MGADATQSKDNRPTGKMVSENMLNLVSGVSTLVDLSFIMGDFIDGIEDVGNNWIKPLRAGFYLVIGQVTFTQVVADKRYQLQLLHREDVGFSTTYAQDNQHSSNTENLTCRIVDVIWLPMEEPIDAFELWAAQFSGVNTVDIIGDALSTFLIVQRLR